MIINHFHTLQNLTLSYRLSGALKKRQADELQHSGLNVQDGEGMDTVDVAKSEKPGVKMVFYGKPIGKMVVNSG